MTSIQSEQLFAREPIEDRIRQGAHELYLQRGDGAGSELEDWLQAEREILAASERERKPQAARVAQQSAA